MLMPPKAPVYSCNSSHRSFLSKRKAGMVGPFALHQLESWHSLLLVVLEMSSRFGKETRTEP